MIFVDTSAIYAYFDADEDDHARVLAAWEGLLDAGAPLLTTNYVLTESVAVLQRRLGMPWVRKLHDLMVPELRLVWIDQGIHERAMRALLLQDRRRVSLVDCACFEVMRDQGIRQVLSLDAHFAEAGFEVLPGALPEGEQDGEGE